MSEVVFFGETFRTADKIGLMPLMRFAVIAKGGVDASEMAGLVALHDLIAQCLADDEWERFQDHATAVRAEGDDLLEVVKQVFEVLSERPTQRPSVSSDGPLTAEPKSTAGSSSPAVLHFESIGRPDLSVVPMRIARSQAS